MTSSLPWFAVNDPDHPPLQSMVESPTYRVNGSSATSFASETGIELGFEYGFTKLVKGRRQAEPEVHEHELQLKRMEQRDLEVDDVHRATDVGHRP